MILKWLTAAVKPRHIEYGYNELLLLMKKLESSFVINTVLWRYNEFLDVPKLISHQMELH